MDKISEETIERFRDEIMETVNTKSIVAGDDWGITLMKRTRLKRWFLRIFNKWPN